MGRRARTALVGLAAAAVLAGASVAAASGRVTPTATMTQAPVDAARTPVVFISMDEFSQAALESAPGVIDARRYPNFAALAGQSTWFSNTTPSADGTRWAQPAVMAGTLPKKARIPIASDYPNSIFTLLGPTHRFNVQEPVTRLCPASLCQGHSVAGRTRKQKNAALNALIAIEKRRAATRSELADFIGTIKPWTSGKPPFYFLHVLMPHHPWVWLPSGKRYPETIPAIPGLHGDNLWRDSPALVNRAWQRYLLQVGYTDRLVGQLIARMKQAGLWEQALVVIVPDHGVSFISGQSRRTASSRTLGGIGVVPFFLKRPGQTLGSRVDAHVQTIDVLPTAADALGLPAPRGIDGHSALAPRFKPSAVAELWSTTSAGRTFGKHTYPMALVRRRFAEEVARQKGLFGTGALGAKFFDLGPEAGLVGRAVAALPPGSKRLNVRLNSPAAGTPAVVSGSLTGVAPKQVVAVVIGGRVAATSRSYRYTTAVRFEAAVARGGPVSVYAVG